MKHINKILCLAALFLGIVTGCSQKAASQPQSSLKPAVCNQEDIAIAKQFGYTADPQIFQFAADAIITLYSLQAESGAVGSTMGLRSDFIRSPRTDRSLLRHFAFRVYPHHAVR